MAIYKNNNGTWYVMIRYQDWTGARKQKCKRGFATRKEAADWELQFKLQKKASLDMTMESFCALYEEDVRPSLKQSTWLTKENIIQKKILPYLGQRKVSEITAKDVMDWHNQMRKLKTKTGKYLSPTYLKTIHGQLSTIFNHAVKYYDLSTNPARKAGALGTEEGKEMLFWTKEEYKLFAEEMMDKPLSYYAFQLLYWCGIRSGELLALTPADFNFKKKTLRINKSYQRLQGKDVITTPKTKNSIRTVVMPQFLCDEMQDCLKLYYSLKPDDRIFPVTKYYLNHEMERGCKACGVKKIRVHDLRHPYVKHTTKIFSLRLKVFQAQPVPGALRKTRGAFQHLREGGTRNPVLQSCNKKRSSWSVPQSKMSLILYAISMRLSGYTSTLSMRKSVSSAVSPSEWKTALAAFCWLSCCACSSCFCFTCANTAA